MTEWKTERFDPGPDPGLDDLVGPIKKPRGKSTGRPPTARNALSEAPLTAGWTVVWRGTRGAATATAQRIKTGTYRPDLLDRIEVAVAHDNHEYLVIWRKKP